MKFPTATLALFAAIPLALASPDHPSVESLPAGGIFAREQFIEKLYCYPVEKVPGLRPGKSVDVKKLLEVVKAETTDIVLSKQTCTVYTCYNNIGVNLCNFDAKDIILTLDQLVAEITEVVTNCEKSSQIGGVKSSVLGYTVTVGAIASIKEGWSCS
ncbi:hypothetical protein V492_01334 [Pseudogymnoascus sp. VKM F-4246]|nr:hypothetical protein V492_01334 [Pseudogymnoascus sp. VKM F-4246]